MSGMKRLLNLLVCGLAGGSALAAAPAAYPDRLSLITTRIEQAADAFLARMQAPAPQPTVRELSAGALALLELGHGSTNAEKLLRRLFSLQDMDPQSPGYGTVPWQEGHPEIKDANAIEFTLLPVGLILLRHGQTLSENLKINALTHVRAGLAAIRRHKVRVTYSNICLMRTANLLLLGQAIGDPNAVAEGEAAFDAWLAFTRTNGVAEYNSPTYTPIQIDCLTLAHNFTTDLSLKARLKAALDFCWAGLAANYFAGRQTMTAPSSRDYSFLFSDESVNYTYYLAGLRQTPPGRVFMSDEVRLWAVARQNGYRPSPEILALASLPERVVRSRFGAQPGQDRYVFLTPDFTIGSAGACYGPQDKPVCVELASANRLPVISFVADPFDAPFGLVRMTDRSGHRKPWHLQPLPVTVQEKGFLLALFDLAPGLKGREWTNLASNVLLPVKADRLWLDGHPVDTTRPFELSAGPDSIVAVREGKAAVAARLFAADACAGRAPIWQVKYNGNAQGAGRLVVYHYRGSDRPLTESSVRAGLLLVAERCETDSDFAAFLDRTRQIQTRPRMEDGIWRVLAKHSSIELEAALDLKQKKIAARRVNGKDWQPEVFSVNGRNWAAETLGNPVPVR
jgi:hypothetical protein